MESNSSWSNRCHQIKNKTNGSRRTLVSIPTCPHGSPFWANHQGWREYQSTSKGLHEHTPAWSTKLLSGAGFAGCRKVQQPVIRAKATVSAPLARGPNWEALGKMTVAIERHCLERGRDGDGGDRGPLSDPESLTRGHESTTSQVRVSGTERDTCPLKPPTLPLSSRSLLANGNLSSSQMRTRGALRRWLSRTRFLCR